MTGTAKRAAKDVLFPLVVVVAAIYLAREFLIPLALAVLVSFLLAPLIVRLERIGLSRIPAVILSVLAALAVLAGVAFVVGGQLVDLAKKLPDYESNLSAKIADFKIPKRGPFAEVKRTIKDISAQMTEPAGGNPAATSDRGVAPPTDRKGQGRRLGGTPPATSDNQPGADPIPVKVVNQGAETGGLDTVKTVGGSILAPLGTAALVLLLVVFFLLEREDMRDRLIHLIGRSHLQVTTQALDEAAARVSRYLLAQFLVNVSYGILIATGLYFIGLPNVLLWGLLATLFRFIPYIGPWLGASLPLLLSLAIFPGWRGPAMSFGLFLSVELICSNVLEPWLYGSSTGMSPIAVIAAATFWTWLWGGIGLLLATPLTVCIAVLGKYIPDLGFIDVLIGDKPPIAPEDRFYQRLLASDEDEVCEIAEKRVKDFTLGDAFEKLIVPTLRLTEEDFHKGSLTDDDRRRVIQEIYELAADLGAPETPAAPPAGSTSCEEAPTVICIPARDLGDEAGCIMLARLLAQSGVNSCIVPSKLLASETLDVVAKSTTRQFCVSVIPPGSARQATYVCKRLRDRFPEARITVGMWGEPEGDERRILRVRRVAVDAIYTRVTDAAREIAGTATAQSAVAAGSPEKPAVPVAA